MVSPVLKTSDVNTPQDTSTENNAFCTTKVSCICWEYV